MSDSEKFNKISDLVSEYNRNSIYPKFDFIKGRVHITIGNSEFYEFFTTAAPDTLDGIVSVLETELVNIRGIVKRKKEERLHNLEREVERVRGLLDECN